MSFFLKRRTEEEQQQADRELFEGLPSFGERLRAQTVDTRIRKNLNDHSGKVESAVVEEITKQIPSEYIVAPDPNARIPTPRQRHDTLFASIARAKAANPKYGNLPATIEDLDAEVDRRRRAELSEAQDVLDAATGFVPELLGDIYAEVSTPTGAIMLGTGLTGAARLIPTMLAEGGLAGLDELRTLGTQQQVAEQLGIEGPRPAQQVGAAALTGAGFAGALVGSGHLLSYSITRSRTTGQRRPKDAPQLTFADQVDDAEQALTRGEDPAAAGSAKSGAPRLFSGVIEAGKGYTVVIGPDGQALRREGTRAWRNNNPGNIEFGRFARSRGAIGTDGRFAVFPTYEAGRAAKASLLWETKNYRGKTIAGAINRYAPPFENNTNAYTNAITRAVGVPASTRMADLTPQQRVLMLDAMEAVEGFRPGTENGVRVQMPSRVTGGDAQPGNFGGYTTSRGYTASGQVSAGRDFRIDVDYEVVDLSTLTRASGALQPRNRARVSSDEQVAEIAATLDPARLMPAPEADRGAPIVGPDNIIESGNGRVMALQRAYQQHPDRADAYRAQIEAAGYPVPEGVTEPVLIGRRTSELAPERRQDFVRQANFSATARMSATERAAVDARGLDADTVALFEPAQPLTSRANVPFTQRILNSLPQSERNALVDGTGRLNAEGVTRVRQAMFARAFDAPDILARYAEADAGDLRGLMDALEGSAPSWAGLRSAIADGRVRDEMDVTPFLMDAMRLIADARRIATRENKASAEMVEELLADVDLLNGALAPLTAALVRKLYPAGRALPAPKVTEFLDRFAAEAQKVGKTDASLFDDTVGMLDVLKRLDKSTFGDLTDTGSARIPATAAPTPADMPSDAIPAEAFAKGAHGPEAEEADAVLQTQIEELIDDLAVDEDLAIPLEDGTTFSTRQILDDLDQDEVLDTVIDLCTAGRAA